jgi:hypothetical protein
MVGLVSAIHDVNRQILPFVTGVRLPSTQLADLARWDSRDKPGHDDFS